MSVISKASWSRQLISKQNDIPSVWVSVLGIPTKSKTMQSETDDVTYSHTDINTDITTISIVAEMTQLLLIIY